MRKSGRPLSHRRATNVRRLALLHRIKQTIQSILPDAEVLLYGSQARGDARPDSDWDLLVLTDTEVTYPLERTLRRQMDDLSLELDVVISAFVYNRTLWAQTQASPYHQHVERDGVVV